MPIFQMADGRFYNTSTRKSGSSFASVGGGAGGSYKTGTLGEASEVKVGKTPSETRTYNPNTGQTTRGRQTASQQAQQTRRNNPLMQKLTPRDAISRKVDPVAAPVKFPVTPLTPTNLQKFSGTQRIASQGVAQNTKDIVSKANVAAGLPADQQSGEKRVITYSDGSSYNPITGTVTAPTVAPPPPGVDGSFDFDEDIQGELDEASATNQAMQSKTA